MAGVLVDIENNFNVDVAAQQPIEVEMKQSGINIDVNSDSDLGLVLQAVSNLKKSLEVLESVCAKDSTIADGVEEIKQAINNIDLSLVAKESTILETKAEVVSSKETLIGKIGDVYSYIATRMDGVISYCASRFDSLVTFVAQKKDELHGFIAADILGAINRNHGEISGKATDIFARQQDFENASISRNIDTINTINSQGSQLGKQIDNCTWEIEGKIDTKTEEIKQALAEIKTATNAIGVISNEDIDALFEE